MDTCFRMLTRRRLLMQLHCSIRCVIYCRCYEKIVIDILPVDGLFLLKEVNRDERFANELTGYNFRLHI